MRLAYVFAGLFLSAAAAFAQSAPEAWRTVATVKLERQSQRTSIPIEQFSERSFGLKLAVRSGNLGISRVTIFYGNGEQLIEERPLQLAVNRDAPIIAERTAQQGGLVIERIEIVHAPTPDIATIDVSLLPLPRGGGGAPRGASTATGYQEVEVLFGTSRQRDGERAKGERKLATFGAADGTELTRGRALVTIPKSYKSDGEIPRPATIDLVLFKFNLRAEDPNRDFTIAAIDVLPAGDFLRRVDGFARTAKAFKRQAFVFVHGYNSSFEDAIFRAAQIASDIGFDGAPIVFSWQSKAGLLDYLHDQAAVGAAKAHLLALLREVASNTSIDQINVIAHSMGNDVLLRALTDEAKDPRNALKLGEIILAAPDVDRAAFSQLAPKLKALSKGVTLYASSSDRALMISATFARRPRAGQIPSGVGPLIVSGVDTIDVSDASTDFFALRHTDFADRRHLVHDIGVLFKQSLHPPDLRSSYVFAPIAKGQDKYWRYLRN